MSYLSRTGNEIEAMKETRDLALNLLAEYTTENKYHEKVINSADYPQLKKRLEDMV